MADMDRIQGLIGFSSNIEPKISAPLDAKTKVKTYASLINPDTWITSDGSEYTFVGLTTTVAEDPDETKNGIYRLKAKPYTDVNNWVKEKPTNLSELTNDVGYATNNTLSIALATKQNNLTAGSGINIDSTTNTISTTENTRSFKILETSKNTTTYKSDTVTESEGVLDIKETVVLDNLGVQKTLVGGTTQVPKSNGSFKVYYDDILGEYITLYDVLRVDTDPIYKELPLLSSNGDYRTSEYAVSSSSHQTGYDAYKFANGTNIDENDCWISPSNGKNVTIYMYFDEKCILDSLEFTNRNYTGDDPTQVGAITRAIIYGTESKSSQYPTWSGIGTITNTVTEANAVWKVEISEENKKVKYDAINIFIQYEGQEIFSIGKITPTLITDYLESYTRNDIRDIDGVYRVIQTDMFTGIETTLDNISTPPLANIIQAYNGLDIISYDPFSLNQMFTDSDESIIYDMIDRSVKVYELPTATNSRLGGVKIGEGISVTSDGVISVNSAGVFNLSEVPLDPDTYEPTTVTIVDDVVHVKPCTTITNNGYTLPLQSGQFTLTPENKKLGAEYEMIFSFQHQWVPTVLEDTSTGEITNFVIAYDETPPQVYAVGSDGIRVSRTDMIFPPVAKIIVTEDGYKIINYTTRSTIQSLTNSDIELIEEMIPGVSNFLSISEFTEFKENITYEESSNLDWTNPIISSNTSNPNFMITPVTGVDDINIYKLFNTDTSDIVNCGTQTDDNLEFLISLNTLSVELNKLTIVSGNNVDASSSSATAIVYSNDNNQELARILLNNSTVNTVDILEYNRINTIKVVIEPTSANNHVLTSISLEGNSYNERLVGYTTHNEVMSLLSENKNTPSDNIFTIVETSKDDVTYRTNTLSVENNILNVKSTKVLNNTGEEITLVGSSTTTPKEVGSFKVYYNDITGEYIHLYDELKTNTHPIYMDVPILNDHGESFVDDYAVTASAAYGSEYGVWKIANGTNVDENDCWLANAERNMASVYLYFNKLNTLESLKFVNRNYTGEDPEQIGAITNFTLQGTTSTTHGSAQWINIGSFGNTVTEANGEWTIVIPEELRQLYRGYRINMYNPEQLLFSIGQLTPTIIESYAELDIKHVITKDDGIYKVLYIDRLNGTETLLDNITTPPIGGGVKTKDELYITSYDPYSTNQLFTDSDVDIIKQIVETTTEEYNLPKATNDTLGGVIVGEGISVNIDGVISVNNTSEFSIIDTIKDPVTNVTETVSVIGDTVYIQATQVTDNQGNTVHLLSGQCTLSPTNMKVGSEYEIVYSNTHSYMTTQIEDLLVDSESKPDALMYNGTPGTDVYAVSASSENPLQPAYMATNHEHTVCYSHWGTNTGITYPVYYNMYFRDATSVQRIDITNLAPGCGEANAIRNYSVEATTDGLSWISVVENTENMDNMEHSTWSIDMSSNTESYTGYRIVINDSYYTMEPVVRQGMILPITDPGNPVRNIVFMYDESPVQAYELNNGLYSPRYDLITPPLAKLIVKDDGIQVINYTSKSSIQSLTYSDVKLIENMIPEIDTSNLVSKDNFEEFKTNITYKESSDPLWTNPVISGNITNPNFMITPVSGIDKFSVYKLFNADTEDQVECGTYLDPGLEFLISFNTNSIELSRITVVSGSTISGAPTTATISVYNNDNNQELANFYLSDSGDTYMDITTYNHIGTLRISIKSGSPESHVLKGIKLEGLAHNVRLVKYVTQNELISAISESTSGISEIIESKQNKLIAGDNIDIVDDTISVTQGVTSTFTSSTVEETGEIVGVITFG